MVSRAASPAENGARLLEVELPAKVTLLSADCEQLASAVGKATLAHQTQAPVILRAALTRGVRKLARGEGKLPCPCAKRIFSVSVAAAPTQASALLDLATELFPDCATELAAALKDYDRVAYDYKDGVDDKNVVAARNVPARNATDPAGTTGDPANAVPSPGDLSDRDLAGLGFSDASGFGTGFGTGFPGSPGFVGSPPSGGVALPPAAVTSVING